MAVTSVTMIFDEPNMVHFADQRASLPDALSRWVSDDRDDADMHAIQFSESFRPDALSRCNCIPIFVVAPDERDDADMHAS